MLRVAICEDDNRYAKEMREMATKSLFSRTDFEIRMYGDGGLVIDEVKRGTFKYDLLLLDINMKTNGLTVADQIRRNNLDIDIIFTTVSTEHVYDGYLYKAFSYLLKPISQDKLSKELNRYLDEKESNTGCLNVTVKGAVRRIALDSILYFESNVRKVNVITQKEEVDFYGKLNDIERDLDDSIFFRCHQSYIINLRRVSGLSRAGVLVGGREIPVSRKYYDALRSKLA